MSWSCNFNSSYFLQCYCVSPVNLSLYVRAKLRNLWLELGLLNTTIYIRQKNVTRLDTIPCRNKTVPFRIHREMRMVNSKIAKKTDINNKNAEVTNTRSLSDEMEDVLSLSRDAASSIDQSDNAMVSSASYPIPDPLSHLLKGAITGLNSGKEGKQPSINMRNNGSDASLSVEVESINEGLKNIVTNAFHALDSMYFAT